MNSPAVKKALDEVLGEMKAMSADELRSDLDKHKNGSVALALKETSQFLRELEDTPVPKVVRLSGNLSLGGLVKLFQSGVSVVQYNAPKTGGSRFLVRDPQLLKYAYYSSAAEFSEEQLPMFSNVAVDYAILMHTSFGTLKKKTQFNCLNFMLEYWRETGNKPTTLTK